MYYLFRFVNTICTFTFLKYAIQRKRISLFTDIIIVPILGHVNKFREEKCHELWHNFVFCHIIISEKLDFLSINRQNFGLEKEEHI